ncbi:hydrophobin precursor [Biscogniauxia mediterranea]|nr:hydrophobin precursor [Biscogniauxia mediterranea]KAI1634707.1 hydrophobin precursor [Biscogniauxia mediterranea]
MQFSTLFVTFLATAVMATPAKRGDYAACSPGLYSTPQCCATDVLGVADLDCAAPSAVPTSADSFKTICATGGQRARCCVLPVAGQDVLCQTPIGV